jgi:hypothetical protein
VSRCPLKHGGKISINISLGRFLSLIGTVNKREGLNFPATVGITVNLFTFVYVYFSAFKGVLGYFWIISTPSSTPKLIWESG